MYVCLVARPKASPAVIILQAGGIEEATREVVSWFVSQVPTSTDEEFFRSGECGMFMFETDSCEPTMATLAELERPWVQAGELAHTIGTLQSVKHLFSLWLVGIHDSATKRLLGVADRSDKFYFDLPIDSEGAPAWWAPLEDILTAAVKQRTGNRRYARPTMSGYEMVGDMLAGFHSGTD